MKLDIFLKSRVCKTVKLLIASWYFQQSSPTPYYTFYYDTGHSDEEEIEEQVLRNTINSEALMTAFHQNQPGTTKVCSHQLRKP